MPGFISRWVLYRRYYKRGVDLEKVILRVGGDMKIIDQTLAVLLAEKSLPRLSIKHLHGKELYGLFLPCFPLIKKETIAGK